MNNPKILEVEALKTYFYTDDGVVRGCDGVSYSVNEGETLAVVGESGSGKSVSCLSIMRLIPEPSGKIVSGKIFFRGRDLVQASIKEIRSLRGKEIAMIFQEPMTSLNPVMTVGRQISESLLLHEKNISKKQAWKKAVELLESVGIASPEIRVDEYPHSMSGGMRQRVMIAMALACNPVLLIADEPTSALDVTIQAQILKLIKQLKEKRGMSVIMITHDLGVVAETADMVAVMYAGKIVEYGTVDELFEAARHPYLQGLQRAVPRLDEEQDELHTIEGIIPDPVNLPSGCKFAPRCPKSMKACLKEEPPAINFSATHYALCWLYAEEGGR